MGELTMRQSGKPPTKAELMQSLKSGDSSTVRAVEAAIKTPAGGEWMAGQIVTLQRLFSNSQADSPIDNAALVMWLHVLGDLPQFAIEQACLDYASQNTSFAPKPGQIRALALGHVANVKAAVLKLRLPHLVASNDDAGHAPTEAERQRMAAEVANFTGRARSIT